MLIPRSLVAHVPSRNVVLGTDVRTRFVRARQGMFIPLRSRVTRAKFHLHASFPSLFLLTISSRHVPIPMRDLTAAPEELRASAISAEPISSTDKLTITSRPGGVQSIGNLPRAIFFAQNGRKTGPPGPR